MVIRMGMIPNPPDKLAVFPHLEMGDQIISNGMCRVLAKSGRQMVWLCRMPYLQDVRAMFSDLSNVQVLGAMGYDDVKRRWISVWPGALKLGSFRPKDFNMVRWDSEFYRHAGIPFIERWKSFALSASLLPKQLVEKKPVVLVHEDATRQYFVRENRLPKGLEVVRITRRPRFWDWLPDILAATELHFIDSSFLNLAESLWHKGLLPNTRLVWHRYAKRYPVGESGGPTVQAPWEIFD